MIKSTLKIASAAALVAISTAFTTDVHAQTFSRPVVVMSGIVRSDETARPTSVKVSIREAGDTAQEITCSTSNKETGKYLVVLSPDKKYWVHLEGDSTLTKDVLISTPPAGQTQQFTQDFTVVLRETDDAAATKASSPQN
jgi:hypothetical protein